MCVRLYTVSKNDAKNDCTSAVPMLYTAEDRMSNFVAGLTNDDPQTKPPVFKQYRYVRYDKKLPASATGSVTFPPSNEKFRYVIIQQKFAKNDAICLAEVKVFLRGRSYNVGTSYVRYM